MRRCLKTGGGNAGWIGGGMLLVLCSARPVLSPTRPLTRPAASAPAPLLTPAFAAPGAMFWAASGF